jgi:hypothetical protein
MASHNRQLHLRGCAKIVHHHCHALLVAKPSVLQNFGQQRLCQVVRSLQLRPLHAGFSVNTEAKLHLMLAELKARSSDCRRSSGRKRNAHGR